MMPDTLNKKVVGKLRKHVEDSKRVTNHVLIEDSENLAVAWISSFLHEADIIEHFYVEKIHEAILEFI